MKDWVFCNKCSLKYQHNVKFYLSECGHILCEKCIEKMKQTRKCAICNKPMSVIELSKDMDFTTQMFFWPLENMLQQSLQVFNFQAMHKNLFLQSLNRKYSYAKRECINYYNAHKKLKHENQMLREMLRSAGCNPPNPFLTSTPASTVQPAYDSNFSMLSSIGFTPAQISDRKEKKVGLPYMCRGGEAGEYHKNMTYNMYLLVEDFRKGTISTNSSTHDPSPVQTVPRGYPVPVHRETSMQNPAASTPNFMERLRGKLRYPSLGYPRK